MTQQAIRTVLEQITSGECQWVGRHDVHVYCRNPLVESNGRWTRGEPTYRVVTPQHDYELQPWVSASVAQASLLGVL
jgi:hypothetical protein